MKRINVTIKVDQYERISNEGLNASGLIRGLLDDHFSETKIVFSVSEDVRRMYDEVISNFGGEDKELEAIFVTAMDSYLEFKSGQIANLRQSFKPSELLK
jgi:hypothetical protein